MAREKTHPYGTRLAYSSNGGSTYTTITECRAIRMPKNEPSKADTTHLESPNRKREKIPSWKDDGECGFTCLFVADQFDTLSDLEAAGTLLMWRVQLPQLSGQSSRSTVVFSAQIASVRLNDIEANDEPVTYDVVLTVSDEETFTAGA